MSNPALEPPYDQLLATAETVAQERGLCEDLVSEDPGSAVLARHEAALDARGELHDPAGVAASLLVCAAVLQL